MRQTLVQFMKIGVADQVTRNMVTTRITAISLARLL